MFGTHLGLMQHKKATIYSEAGQDTMSGPFPQPTSVPYKWGQWFPIIQVVNYNTYDIVMVTRSSVMFPVMQ